MSSIRRSGPRWPIPQQMEGEGSNQWTGHAITSGNAYRLDIYIPLGIFFWDTADICDWHLFVCTVWACSLHQTHAPPNTCLALHHVLSACLPNPRSVLFAGCSISCTQCYFSLPHWGLVAQDTGGQVTTVLLQPSTLGTGNT